MIKYKKLDVKIWSDFGKSILHTKGSPRQRRFLETCLTGKDSFLQYLHENFVEGKVVGDQSIALQYKFMEQEFLFPPKDTQEVIWNAFSSVHDEDTSSCEFWAYIIINMIRHDHIEPKFLASQLNGKTKNGGYAIDNALKSGNEETVDVCARRILRSMCNPEPRGKRIVFNDFYLGKSYWRWCWANKMVRVIGLDFDVILKIFDEDYYAEFSAKMHTGKSYISAEKILGGLLLWLKGTGKSKIGQAQLRVVIDNIAYLSAWKGIEEQNPTFNKAEIEKLVEVVLD